MLAILALSMLPLAQAGAAEAWRGLAPPSLVQERAGPEAFAALLSGRHVRLAGDPPEESVAAQAAHLPLPALAGLLTEDAARARRALRVEPGGPPLLVRGTGEALDAAAALCAQLDRQGRALEIELTAWLTPGAARVGTHPSRAVFEAATAGVTPLGRERLRSGSRAALGVRRATDFIGGYEVQVASGSAVAAPRLGQVRDGHTLHVRASRARSGRTLVIEGLLDLAELTELSAFDPDTRDLGLLQLPSVSVLQVAFAGAIESGGVLCVSVAGSGLPQADWTLWIEAGCLPDEAGSWRLCDLALLEGEVSGLPLPHAGLGFEPQTRERAGRTSLGSLGAAAVAQAADSAHGAGARGGRATIVWSGGLVLAPAGEELLWREVDSLVGAAEQQRLEGALLRVRHGGLAVQLPVLEGRPARVLVGREQVRLAGYDLQTAQDTWMPEPRLEHAFDGLLVQGHLEHGRLRGQAWRAASEPERVLERSVARLARLSAQERRLAQAGLDVGAGDGASSVLPGSDADAALELELELRPAGS